MDKRRIRIGDLVPVPATEAKNKFGEVLHRACYEKKAILVERNGTPMAVILSLDEYERLLKLAAAAVPGGGGAAADADAGAGAGASTGTGTGPE